MHPVVNVAHQLQQSRAIARIISFPPGVSFPPAFVFIRIMYQTRFPYLFFLRPGMDDVIGGSLPVI